MADYDLPPRSRASVTDLSTGDGIALAEGDIVEAMLASMAVPGLFPPQEINGQIVVDGGLSAQLPVQYALDLGADIIIAIDTTVEPNAVTETMSIVATTQQLIKVTVWRNFVQQRDLLRDGDILIRPDLSELSTGAFERAPIGIAAGRAAADPFRTQLAHIASIAAPGRDRIIDQHHEWTAPQTLLVQNNTSVPTELIERRFNYDPAFASNERRVGERLRDLAAFGAFGEVDLAYSDNVAVLTVGERDLGRTQIQMGLRASNSFDGDSTYGLLARISHLPLRNVGGEFSLTAEFGTDLGLRVEYTLPFGPDEHMFIEPALFYVAEEVMFDFGDFRLAELWEEKSGAQLRIGMEFGNWGMIALDGTYQYREVEPVVSIFEDFDENYHYNYGDYGVSVSVDTLNRIDWPTEGTYLRAQIRQLYDLTEETDATDLYETTFMQAAGYGNWGGVFRFMTKGVDHADDNPMELARLGGFRRLSAFTEHSLPADHYRFASLEVFRQISPGGSSALVPLYLGVTAEYAETEFNLFDETAEITFKSLSVYLGADTLFGPAYLGAATSLDGYSNFFFHFGRSF